MLLLTLIVLLVLAAVTTFVASATGNECAARKEGESYVCVCNATYCDTLEREEPTPGKYVMYTSSKAGLRFSKTGGNVESASLGYIASIAAGLTGRVVLKLTTSKKYQTIQGFGAAVTDSAAINWRNLSTTLQDTLIKTYFGRKGLEYNMIRVPIGGSDFSTHAYAYNELPENDAKLTNYTLPDEDTKYKLPMIKAALAEATAELHVVATTWSPPLWMKTNGKWFGVSRLKTEYYQTYADYHLKFLELYLKHGVKTWAVTTTNEPINGVVPVVRFNSLGWTPSSQTKWIVDNLGPTLRTSTDPQIKDVLILAVDDQRYTVPLWFQKMVDTNKTVLDYVAGIGVHYYGDFVPAAVLTWTHNNYPNMFLLGTEGCEGSSPLELKKVILGSWRRASNYITDIIQDLNYWFVGWMDWNLCLNAEGGPNWANNRVDSPVIVFPEKDEFVKQPMFYAMGHFSKFIPRGSQRIDVTKAGILSVDHVAFLTPRNNIVLVLYNSRLEKTVEIVVDNKRKFSVKMSSDSVATIEIQQ